jgi:FAD/FMN-containing dehydrogenase
VSRVHLRLVPSLPDRVVALCGLDDLDGALACCATLRRGLDSLLALEAFFAEGLTLVREHAGLPAPFSETYGVYLLVECGGRAGVGDAMLDSLGTLLERCAAVRETAVAQDPPARERLWAYRERHTEAVNALGVPHKLDVTLPFDRLAEFEHRVAPAIHALEPGARVVCFGHLGDGNLHVNVVGPAPDDERVDDVVLGLAASMQGSISAEHGIGAQKRHLLPIARGAADIDTMRAVKRAFDPDGLLHPGVLFP